MGVCLDTCHVFDGGYDIARNLDAVLDRLNDSMNPIGSRKSRYEKIGKGYIGIDAFVRIINHPLLRGLPFCLGTPNDVEGYGQEIALLKSVYQN